MRSELIKEETGIQFIGEEDDGLVWEKVTDPDEIAKLEAEFSGENTLDDQLKRLARTMLKMKIRAIFDLYRHPIKAAKIVRNQLVRRLCTILRRA